jgi:predicted acylesterase/phospholipase RssA
VDSSRQETLALCLSGGGFRATFFHLGVIRYLAEMRCLEKVQFVFSVSGGSILAAHLALHWDDYLSSDSVRFRQASNELVRFGQSDLRGRIMRRALFKGRTELLEAHYGDLFRNARLSSLPKTPRFYFLATSMTTGALCAFDRDFFVVVNDRVSSQTGADVVQPSCRRYPAESQPLARAVAASSAFPPMFPPLHLDLADLGRAEFPIPDRLTDGGVFDNLGLSRLHVLLGQEVKDGLARIIVSDASAQFDHKPNARFSTLFSRTIRTTDVLMQRVASLESELWRKHERLLVVGIGDSVRDTDLPPGHRPLGLGVQRRLRQVRTDFDVFESDVIRALVRHGHEVACKNLRSAVPGATRAVESAPWDPIPPGWPKEENIAIHRAATGFDSALSRHGAALADAFDLLQGRSAGSINALNETQRSEREKLEEQLENTLDRAATRALGLWNARDPMTWALIAAMLLGGALLAFGSLR